jgi:hypothetical protein
MDTYLFASQLLGLRESRNCQYGAIRMENAAHLPPSSLSLRAEMNVIRHFSPSNNDSGRRSPLPFRASFELAPRALVISYAVRETLIPVKITKSGGLPRTIR